MGPDDMTLTYRILYYLIYISYFLDLFLIPRSRETGFADRPVLAFKGYPNLEILGETLAARA